MAEVVKKNKKAQTPKEKLTAPKKIKILFTIVERRKVDFYLDVLEGYEVNLQTVFYGKGTAPSEIAHYLGLVNDDKAVILSIVREDKIKEVVDGQQRLLTILGFLGKTYIDERGEIVCTDKDKFRLSKLKILSELNGKTIETVGDKFEEKILEFPMDIIEIDAEQNPDFSQIDLFLRLNTKPYPIKENTFEMWNAYIDKDIVTKVKEIAAQYEKRVFKARDTRMKLEELITSLGYLDYRMNQPHTEIINVLNIYKRNDRMCARIMSKDNVTKILSELSNTNPKAFVKALENVELFVNKILTLIEDDTEKLRELFNHSKKGVQYKTDQNFYFLWALLFKISLEELQKRRKEEFERISKIFSLIQKTPSDYTTEIFLNEL